jgi:hypothetical protein
LPPDSDASPNWNVKIAFPPSSAIISELETKDTFGAVSSSTTEYSTTFTELSNSIFSAALTLTLIVSAVS